MKGIDKQHIPEGTDDVFSIFTDVAGSVDLSEKRSTEYWPSSSGSDPHDIAFELEGDGVDPSAAAAEEVAEEVADEYWSVSDLPSKFLQSAMAQLALARNKSEPELRYLGRLRQILKRMTLDEFELLVGDVDPKWVPKGSLWREFGHFQFQAGILIGKRETASEILDRLKLEQGLNHKEPLVGVPQSIHDILAGILKDKPALDTSSSTSSTDVYTGEQTIEDAVKNPKVTDEEETREKSPRASSYGRTKAKDHLKPQKTIAFSVLRSGSHAKAVRTPPMRTWDYEIPYSFQKSEDSDQQRSDTSVLEDDEDMKMASMLSRMF
ncbi:uncharacterized protein PG986_008323 [Apiospora aurea]|uniref:Uncharacterized protein n=1 Tax=Apiospora aurea TaxID=335848 RepID=A0ABR1QF46_9PEZI